MPVIIWGSPRTKLIAFIHTRCTLLIDDVTKAPVCLRWRPDERIRCSNGKTRREVGLR